MVILGISCFYHDAAACILKDGRIVAAAAEERFTRKKHDNGFPRHAIDFCLRRAGISANEIDYIAFYEKPILKFERIISQHLQHFPKSAKVYVESMGLWFNEKLQIKKLLEKEFYYHGKVVFIPHHLSHAASAYYLSGFKKAAIVTIDGVGEWATTTMGFGEGPKIIIEKEIRFPHSLGLFYSAITTYLGFKANNDEYKVMGLAAYGSSKPFREKMDKLISVFNDGSFALDMKYFDYTWADYMVSKNLEKHFGYPKRTPESKVLPHHEDIAAALQAKLEEVELNLLKSTYKKYRTQNLCLAGGVALNSVFNGKIVKKTPFKNVFIPPDPGDGGGAMGAAFYIHTKFSKKPIRGLSPYLGPDFAWYEIRKTLKQKGLSFKLYTNKEKLIDMVVEQLNKKKVVGWFQGRMEWGPRALGARSILADASDAKMKDIINEKVKKREMFRPFAPVILEDKVSDYFKDFSKGVGKLGTYMLLVLPFKDKGKKAAPATVHVDGTGRLQSIRRGDNPLYYDLVDAYMRKTGNPILINTSFNVRGEPIVCTPEDALNCFLATEIDILVIGDFVVTKK